MTDIHVKKSGSDSLHVVEAGPAVRWGADANLDVVGRPYPRVEDIDKVTGRARYSYDVHLPGQLYARVLRSPHPHARIRHVETARAEALPGVHAVLSSANAPMIPWYEDSCLFDTTVRFVGDEIAAVAAESEEIAGDALRLINAAYEPLPFVTDLTATQQPDAPRLRQNGNVAGKPQEYHRGDTDAGFREADVVIDDVYTTQTALHNCMEPHGCTADWAGDRLTLWDSTQGIFSVRQQVAQALGLPEHHVRVITQFMGGGFGSKQIAWKQDVIAALLSKHAGRPVQLMLDRHAENLAVGNRNATTQHVRLGARQDGTLTAIWADIALENGAYRTGGEASDVAGIYHALYRCPNVRTKQTAWYTNTGPAVAFRAPGYVEGTFPLEQAMDELARRLGLDPVALRLRNYADEDQEKGKPYTIPGSLRVCYERATEVFGWNDWHRPPPDGAKQRGRGFAAHNWIGGAGHPPGYAWVKLNADGTADVVTGTQDIGTGTRTGLTQVAAEALGFPIERVALHLGDTSDGPYAPTSAGSSTQPTMGPAVLAAALDAKRQLLDAAATVMEVPADRLSVCDGKIRVAGEPDERAEDVAAVTGRIAPHMIQGIGARGPNPPDKAIRTFGAQCVEVEVDTATGEVTVLRVVASHDCGRVINPTMADSQVIGAVTMGIGYGLTEERIVDDRLGVVLNANLEEYTVPTVADVPAITYAMADLPDPAANATGAKGIGEPPLVPTAPAIANAVFDAIAVRVRDAPLTRRRLLELLQQREGQEGSA